MTGVPESRVEARPGADGRGTPVAAATRPPLPLALLRAMRPKQWIKNVLLFAGFVFTLNERWRPLSHEMWSFLGRSTVAFVLFSLAASCIYLLNDVLDVDKDRLH